MDQDAIKDEIKRRIRIEDIVSRHVSLQRAGGRLKGRCPFHEEKTPSFYVNPELGLWKCFGCGAGGDLFEFIMKIEGLTFSEAAERLAERVGLEWRAQQRDPAVTHLRQMGRKANDLAVEYYQKTLQATQGREGLEYLAQKRGFTPETIATFKLGYVPDGWDNLLRNLRSQGIDEAVAMEAGLARQGTSGGCYDVFRHRVMFPILDVSERVIGFGGRALDPADPAKYLNTADTAAFKKGRNLYALNLARPAITRDKQAIIVEGYTDVISLHQAGIENVVACLGTALTTDHLQLLSRYADEIILAYDADAAGMNAAARNIPMLESCPAEVRIVILPPGLDPDECVRKQGAEGFRELIGQRLSPVEYLISLIYLRHVPQGAEGLTLAAREAVQVLLNVTDESRRNSFLQQVADRQGERNPARTEAIERTLREELRTRRAQQGPQARVRRLSPRDRGYISETVSRHAESVPPGILELERELLSLALSWPEITGRILYTLKAADFTQEKHIALFEAIEDIYPNSVAGFNAALVVDGLREQPEIQALALELSMTGLDVVDEEVLAANMGKLIQYRTSGGHRPSYEVEVVEVAGEEEGEEAEGPVEDYEDLRSWVAQQINAGLLDPEDPRYLRYKTLMVRLHGNGLKGNRGKS